jgi:hypothetical protein
MVPFAQNEKVIQNCLLPNFPKVLEAIKLFGLVGCIPQRHMELFGISADGSAVGIVPGTRGLLVPKVRTPVEDTLKLFTTVPLNSNGKGTACTGDQVGIEVLLMMMFHSGSVSIWTFTRSRFRFFGVIPATVQ